MRDRGVTGLFMFGSFARDQTHAASDVDLFLDYDPARKFSLVDLAGVKLSLEDVLRVPVDVTTRDSLHPLIRAEIEREALRIL